MTPLPPTHTFFFIILNAAIGTDQTWRTQAGTRTHPFNPVNRQGIMGILNGGPGSGWVAATAAAAYLIDGAWLGAVRGSLAGRDAGIGRRHGPAV